MSAKTHLLRSAKALWSGSLKGGEGSLDLQSESFKGQDYSFESRFEDEDGRSGTNPEELLAAAHAGCYAMQLSHFLSEAGHPPKRLEVRAEVRMDQEKTGYEISSSILKVDAFVPGMEKEEVLEWAEKAKTDCPISKALKGVEIGMEVHVPTS